MKTTKKESQKSLPTGGGADTVENRQSPPMISCGKKEKDLLGVLSTCDGKHFSINWYSKRNNIPRSTLYSMLNKLVSEGLAASNTVGYRITPAGNQLVSLWSLSNPPVGIARYPCRKGLSETNLSVHKIKFKMALVENNIFHEKQRGDLKPEEWKEVQLPNFKMHILYYEDATLIFKKKTVEIYVREIAGKTLEESFLDIFSIATKYAHKLEALQLVKETLEMEKGHYARVESILATVLEKVDSKYRLEIAPGKFFWIDTSFKLEDETNDDEMREKLDKNLIEMFHSEASFKDIDKIIQALGLITKIQATEIATFGKGIINLTESQKITTLQLNETLKFLMDARKSDTILPEEPQDKPFYVG